MNPCYNLMVISSIFTVSQIQLSLPTLCSCQCWLHWQGFGSPRSHSQHNFHGHPSQALGIKRNHQRFCDSEFWKCTLWINYAYFSCYRRIWWVSLDTSYSRRNGGKEQSKAESVKNIYTWMFESTLQESDLGAFELHRKPGFNPQCSRWPRAWCSCGPCRRELPSYPREWIQTDRQLKTKVNSQHHFIKQFKASLRHR